MPSSCCVVGCNSNSYKDASVTFSRFPKIFKDPKLKELSIHRRNQWIRAIRRGHKETQIDNLLVCSKHFISGKPAKLCDVKHPDWVPCRNLGYAVGKAIRSEAALTRYERSRLREGSVDEATIAISAEDNMDLSCDTGGDSDRDSRKDVVELTDENFANLIYGSSDHWLVEFYDNGCDHCQRLKPECVEAASILKAKNVNVKFGSMDAPGNAIIPGQYNMQGYPKIRWFEPGSSGPQSASDYDGDYNTTEIVDWILNRIVEHTYTQNGFKSSDSQTTIEAPSSSPSSSQTVITMDDLKAREEDSVACNARIHRLEAQLNELRLDESKFRNDANESSTLYYTGLSHSRTLFGLLNLVKDNLPNHPLCALAPFQILLLTLIKLRLNLDFRLLAHMFFISPPTASQYFHKCLTVLYTALKPLIVWPTRSILKKTMPASFRDSFGDNIVVIVDCFEVRSQRPSDPVLSGSFFSHYKHCHTTKFLIGITPQGTVSFISEAWVGRASDKHVAEQCGFLLLLQEDDTVVVDRGFTIDDAVEETGARLARPAFVKRQNQLHPTDIERSKNIATIRIHVERVISSIRQKYRILDDRIRMTMMTSMDEGVSQSVMDEVVVVVGALINLCPSVIPAD